MKTTKGGKVMNPTDAYRKELRKRELKRNKKERKKVREVGILKKDPEAIRDQIRKLEMMKADGALDKTRRHKKRQLEDTLNLVLKKRREYEEKMREKGEEPIMFSHLSAPRRRTAEEEQRAKNLKPEDSVYFHPTLNPTGAPPPGKPPMYKSSVGPRIPLTADGTDPNTEVENEAASLPLPPPPPLPPLPPSDTTSSDMEEQTIPLSVPVPPPPPAPPRPPLITSVVPPPPPPPGPPPKLAMRPPPPPPPRPLQPPPPGIGIDMTGNPAKTDEEKVSKEKDGTGTQAMQDWAPQVPPPPPRALLQESRVDKDREAHKDAGLQQRPPPPPLRPPPPPPPPQPVLMRPMPTPPLPVNHTPEILPPGVSRFPPPPPPPGVRPPLPGPPPPPRVAPPAPPPGRPHLGLATGPSSIISPPGLVPGQETGMPLPIPAPPPRSQDGIPHEESGKARPSYVKSAAATVVKRPLAQHTPELTAMVPASVRVRRESVQKPKPKPTAAVNVNISGATKVATTQPASKPHSIDESYLAFLEDMKALGAFEDGTIS